MLFSNTILPNLYISSDTHFGHENMYKYEPIRKSEMQKCGFRSIDELMIQRWSETVGKDDIIFHLGDFAILASAHDTLKKLNGKKILLRGNHDKGNASSFISRGWDDVIEGVHILLDDGIDWAQHLRNHIAANRLSHNLLNCVVAEYGGKRILFSHFPVFDDNPFDEKFKNITTVLEEIYMLCKCDINIHGHVHSKTAKELCCVNACVEHHNFRPVKFGQLFECVEKQV